MLCYHGQSLNSNLFMLKFTFYYILKALLFQMVFAMALYTILIVVQKITHVKKMRVIVIIATNALETFSVEKIIVLKFFQQVLIVALMKLSKDELFSEGIFFCKSSTFFDKSSTFSLVSMAPFFSSIIFFAFWAM